MCARIPHVLLQGALTILGSKLGKAAQHTRAHQHVPRAVGLDNGCALQVDAAKAEALAIQQGTLQVRESSNDGMAGDEHHIHIGQHQQRVHVAKANALSGAS